MAPTIGSGDIVVINTAERQMRMGDQVWAISINGAGYIKRLRPLSDGYEVVSDNDAVKKWRVPRNELYIVGRVVAAVRRL
jgi:phage repressor protein C with HTH and peptisase S24 domain